MSLAVWPSRPGELVRRLALPRAATADLAVIGHWLVLRALVAIVAAASLWIVPLPASPDALRLSPDLIGYAEVTRWLAAAHADATAAWTTSLWRYDAVGFVQIARAGYAGADPGVTAFPPLFPLYPLAIRGLEIVLPDQWLLAALIVSAAAAVASALLLGRLAARELGRGRVLAPTLLLAFPSAFFLSAPYAEGLFLALSLGSLLAARDRHWLLGGGLGLLAGLTRLNGVCLCVPLAILAWRARRQQPARANLAASVVVLGPAAGVLLALGSVSLAGAHILASRTTPGFAPLAAARELIATPPEQLVAVQFYALPMLLAAIACLAWAWRHLPQYLNWYGVAVVLPGLTVVHYPALSALPRYLLACAPLFLGLALWASSPWRRIPLLALSVLAQLVLVALFAQWTWLG